MKKIVRYITIIVAAVLLSRCANIVTPSGGPKDEKPPVVLETSPENNTANFKGKTIHITFDEFVTLNNASNNVLISPPMDKKPTFRTSGKTLIIRFEEPLKPETTYSINFGNAIKDLHEGNVFNEFSFNFSTGESIDSLSLKGKLLSASTLTPVEDCIIGLYSLDNDTLTLDSIPYKLKPSYITITNKKGNFEFSGLADKEYLLFALKDNNSNLIYDLPNEEIAFHTELVKPYYINSVNDTIHSFVTDSLITIDSLQVVADSTYQISQPEHPVYTLFSFVQEDSIQKIFKKELVEDGLLRFVFRYPADNVSITALEELPDTFNIMSIYSARKDTVLWYFTPCIDSLWISINDGINISDTTHYSLKPRESATKKKRKNEEQAIKKLVVKNNLKSAKLKPEERLILSFNEPIVELKLPDTALFVENKDTVYQNLKVEKADEYGFKYLIDNHLNQGSKYQLIIPDSVFFGIRGYTNDSIKLSFSVQEESAFGNIFLTVEVPENVPQVIIELTDDKGKTIEKQIITKTQELSLKYLDPGKYKLKATLDLDANGVWSAGNFGKRLQPEKIVFYNGTLEVRANWDIDLDEPWILEK